MLYKQIISAGLFFIFSSSIAYQRHGTIWVESNKPASEYYSEKTRAFLKHLKVPNSEQVPVQLIFGYDILLSENEDTPALKLGSANSSGIWLNEQVLEKETVAERLFTIAHEAAHYALQHTKNIIYINKKMNWLRGLSVFSFCGIGSLNQSEHLNQIEQPVLGSADNNSKLKLMTRGIKGLFAASIAYVGFTFLKKKILKNTRLKNEEQADEFAVYTLCDFGYTWAVKERVKTLKIHIDAGDGDWSDGQHPTIKEEYYYIKKYFKLWKQRDKSTQKQIT